VTVSALYMEQGETLAADLGESQVKVIPFPVKRETLENRPALIVNATPLGMSPQLEENPWPEGVPFPAGAFIYDLVYNPVETTLVKSARAAGLRAFTGTGMLVEQAALSWELWTGIPAPRQAMRQAASFETEAE